MKVCKLHPLATWRAKCYANPCQGGGALLCHWWKRNTPPGFDPALPQKRFAFFNQHVTEDLKGGNQARLTFSAT